MDIGVNFIFGVWGGLMGTSFRIIIRSELINVGSFLSNEHLHNVVVTSHAFIIIFFRAAKNSSFQTLDPICNDERYIYKKASG